MRLVDEITTLKEKYPNSVSIRVIRNNYDNKLTYNEKNHLTEVDLDNYNNFDYKVENNENLEEKIKKILSEV